MQLFISKFGYGKFYPHQSKAEAGASLCEFIQDEGIPDNLHTDEAKEMMIGICKQVYQDACIRIHKQKETALGKTVLKWRSPEN